MPQVLVGYGLFGLSFLARKDRMGSRVERVAFVWEGEELESW
jgi:hypothetical protein